MSRIASIYRGKPITPKTGGAAGEVGELKIIAVTTAPSTVADADFEIVGNDSEGQPLAPPRYLTVACRTAGTDAATADVPFWLAFWDPDVGQWHHAGPFFAAGLTTLTTNYDRSQIARPEVPDGATHGMIHVPSHPAGGLELHFTVRRGN